jgi:hypothetical protein
LTLVGHPSPLAERADAWLREQRGLRRLGDALALSCQEDLVLMRELPDGSAVAEWLHVCLPSGWDPAEKVGRDFAAIHAPVADKARLLGSADNVMKAMLTKGPYVRFGWGLTTCPSLNAHPTVEAPWDDAWLSDPAVVAARTYVRMERQTTLALPGLGRALFTIRIYLTPLTDRLAAEPELRPRIATLLRSCSPAVLAYKGMTELVPPLLAWLEATGEQRS